MQQSEACEDSLAGISYIDPDWTFQCNTLVRSGNAFHTVLILMNRQVSE